MEKVYYIRITSISDWDGKEIEGYLNSNYLDRKDYVQEYIVDARRFNDLNVAKDYAEFYLRNKKITSYKIIELNEVEIASKITEDLKKELK